MYHVKSNINMGYGPPNKEHAPKIYAYTTLQLHLQNFSSNAKVKVQTTYTNSRLAHNKFKFNL